MKRLGNDKIAGNLRSQRKRIKCTERKQKKDGDGYKTAQKNQIGSETRVSLKAAKFSKIEDKTQILVK